jgi:hypothetical protein
MKTEPTRNTARRGAGKVFGIGLSRTGTLSLTLALRRLGFVTEHFPDDDVSQAELTRFLEAPTERLTLSLLKSFDALTDTPVSASYRALDRAYPGSRFILTTRDKGAWLASCEVYWDKVLRHLLERMDAKKSAYVNLVNRAVYGVEHFDASAFSEAHDAHVRVVHEYFAERPEFLLPIDICAGDGWAQLCGFLGVEQPRDDFPYVNAVHHRDGSDGTGS